MKRGLFLCLILLAACQQATQCDEKIACDDGSIFPAEHVVDGICEPVNYPGETPCADLVEIKSTCTIDEDCIPDTPLISVKYVCEDERCTTKPLGNPAAQKCIDDGGDLGLREDLNGTYNVCLLPSGEECEEWAYYRGECPVVLEGCAAVPVAERAHCCQKELGCDVTKIAVYDAGEGVCKCEFTEVKRECAGIACQKGQLSVFDPNVGGCTCIEAGTRAAIGSATEETEPKTNITLGDAKQLVIDAFDKKWRKIPGGCGEYKDGKIQPESVFVWMKGDGSYTAHIEYYCGEYFKKPAEPDHKKELVVTVDGEVIGLE